MLNKHFFIIDTYRKIKNNLPNYVFNSIKKLIPIYLVATLFEFFGLVIIFPVIKIVINPSIIDDNKIVNHIFQILNFSNKTTFVLFLFTSVTLIFILKNVILFFISKKQTSISFQLASKLSYEKYSSYVNKPYSFHNDTNTSVLLRNFAQLPFDFVSFLIIPFTIVVNELFILFLIILIITCYAPLLFWSLILFTVPFLAIYNVLYKKKLKDISDKRDSQSRNMYKTGHQTMEAYREITIFGKQIYFKNNFKKTLNSYSQTLGEVYFLNSFSPKIIEIVAVLGIFSIFLAGYIFNKDLATLAQFLIVFSIAAYRVIPSLNKVILFSNYIKSSLYIFDYFDKTESKTESNVASSGSIIFDDKIELRNLSFNYPLAHNNIFTNLNLIIKKGETIGIIGSSGGGKTTLLNILLRLYQETEGGIYIDNKKLTQKNLDAWYKLVAYVPQNVTLLDSSIVENIAFGFDKKDIDYELLKKVIHQSQLNEFIMGLPEGFETQIGENGVKISGGQRQRLGIARALYHGSKILIFDEATSALDKETEQDLTESINKISNNELTIIIVAHRIETLIYCDRIYSLIDGKIELNVDSQY